jgi:enoyl-CoA hydratase
VSSQRKMSTTTRNNNEASPLVILKRQVLPESGKEVAIVSINRSDRLNSFNTEVCHELARIFTLFRQEAISATKNDLVAVIFTGEGPNFCSGADLSDPPNPLQQSSDLPDDLAVNPVHQMQQLDIPVIAALKGHVITGGFELALACDILIGDTTTKFRDTQVMLGQDIGT